MVFVVFIVSWLSFCFHLLVKLEKIFNYFVFHFKHLNMYSNGFGEMLNLLRFEYHFLQTWELSKLRSNFFISTTVNEFLTQFQVGKSCVAISDNSGSMWRAETVDSQVMVMPLAMKIIMPLAPTNELVWGCGQYLVLPSPYCSPLPSLHSRALVWYFSERSFAEWSFTSSSNYVLEALSTL